MCLRQQIHNDGTENDNYFGICTGMWAHEFLPSITARLCLPWQMQRGGSGAGGSCAGSAVYPVPLECFSGLWPADMIALLATQPA